MTRRRRRAGAGLLLLVLMIIAFTATWIAANGESPCGWGVFRP
jgi:hypothetical protein